MKRLYVDMFEGETTFEIFDENVVCEELTGTIEQMIFDVPELYRVAELTLRDWAEEYESGLWFGDVFLDTGSVIDALESSGHDAWYELFDEYVEALSEWIVYALEEGNTFTLEGGRFIATFRLMEALDDSDVIRMWTIGEVVTVDEMTWEGDLHCFVVYWMGEGVSIIPDSMEEMQGYIDALDRGECPLDWKMKDGVGTIIRDEIEGRVME